MRAPDPALTAEPRIADMLDDPVVQAVMARDRVQRNDILDLILAVRQRLDTPPVAARDAAIAA